MKWGILGSVGPEKGGTEFITLSLAVLPKQEIYPTGKAWDFLFPPTQTQELARSVGNSLFPPVGFSLLPYLPTPSSRLVVSPVLSLS